jgi:hypothetical protein
MARRQFSKLIGLIETKIKSTCVQTAFVPFLRTTAGKGDVGITSVFVSLGVIWFLTTDE